jgi:hypothetical protein
MSKYFKLALAVLIGGAVIGAVIGAELGSGSGTSYPTALDTDNTVETADDYAREDVPNDSAAAIVAIQNELGTVPKGAYPDVKTRLNALVVSSGTAILSAITPYSSTTSVNGSFNIRDTLYVSSIVNNGDALRLAGSTIFLQTSALPTVSGGLYLTGTTALWNGSNGTFSAVGNATFESTASNTLLNAFGNTTVQANGNIVITCGGADGISMTGAHLNVNPEATFQSSVTVKNTLEIDAANGITFDSSGVPGEQNAIGWTSDLMAFSAWQGYRFTADGSGVDYDFPSAGSAEFGGALNVVGAIDGNSSLTIGSITATSGQYSSFVNVSGALDVDGTVTVNSSSTWLANSYVRANGGVIGVMAQGDNGYRSELKCNYNAATAFQLLSNGVIVMESGDKGSRLNAPQSPLSLQVGGATKMQVDGSANVDIDGSVTSGSMTVVGNAQISGRVGIGNVAPKGMLHLSSSGTVYIDGANSALSIGAGGTNGTIKIGPGAVFENVDTRDNRDIAINYDPDGAAGLFRGFYIYNGKRVAMLMANGSSGNIGIGNTSPGAKLAVTGHGSFSTLQSSGTIHATGNITSQGAISSLGIVYSSGSAKMLARYSGAPVTIPGDIIVQVTYSSEVFDTANAFTIASSTFVAPASGYYVMNATLRYTSGVNTGTEYYLQLNKNGILQAQDVRIANASDSFVQLQKYYLVYAEAGDRLTVSTFHMREGFDAYIGGDPIDNWFSVYWVP